MYPLDLWYFLISSILGMMDQNSRFWWNLFILSNSFRFAICGPSTISSITISITWKIKNWQSRRAIRHTVWCEKWNHRNQQKRREIHVHVDASCLNGRQLGNSSKKNIYKQELLIRHALQIIERRLNSYTKPMEPVFIAEINKYHPPRQRSQPLFILMSSGG